MSLQVATRPCWKMDVPDVISAIFVWALGSVPRHDPTVLFVRFFPLDIGFPLGSRGSAREKFPQRSFMWGNISRLQPFVYLQAPILAWPTDCSDLFGLYTHSATGPYTPGSTRTVTGYEFRYLYVSEPNN